MSPALHCLALSPGTSHSLVYDHAFPAICSFQCHPPLDKSQSPPYLPFAFLPAYLPFDLLFFPHSSYFSTYTPLLPPFVAAIYLPQGLSGFQCTSYRLRSFDLLSSFTQPQRTACPPALALTLLPTTYLLVSFSHSLRISPSTRNSLRQGSAFHHAIHHLLLPAIRPTSFINY